MFKNIILLISVLSVLIGCGGPKTFKAEKDVAKRPSMLYQPDNRDSMKMKYPLSVGILKLNDKRVLPFYSQKNFFKESDIDGLQQITFLELKRSGLFETIVNIPEIAPKQIDDQFLKLMHQKYQVDMILVLDVTNFNLFRAKMGKELMKDWTIGNMFGTSQMRKEYAIGSFSMQVRASMVGQLIYYDGGYIVWSGEMKRADLIPVTDAVLTPSQLALLSRNTLKPLFSDLKRHIAKNGKRMATQ